MSNDLPFISVIIPCRNEERFLRTVLDDILRQDYPHEKMELLVVDGQSDDQTVSIIKSYCTKHAFIFYLENPDRVVPHALNIAIRKSRGDVILRMDAHAEYPSNYISSLVKVLFENKVDNVGGVWITEPGDSSGIAKAIAIGTSHPFGIGNAYYRLGASKPVFVDTVPYGCYKKEVFTRIGYFDEQLVRNQDDEFNGRLIKSGGKILLLPEIKIRYYARETIRKMSRMFYQYGLYKPLVNIKLGKPATLRQLFPPALIISLLSTLITGLFIPFVLLLFQLITTIYLTLVVLFSIQLGFKKKLSLRLLLVFPTIHFSYGWGYLCGIWRFIVLRQHTRNKIMTSETTR